MNPKLIKLLALIAIITIILPIASINTTAQVIKGPPADKLIYTIRTSQSVGIIDTAKGELDVFLWAAPMKYYVGLPADLRAKIRLIPIRSTLYALLWNPYHDDTPEGKWGIATDKDTGEKVFNPFALQKIRYAMNWLISREYIIREILAGSGKPMYCPVGPDYPAYKLGDLEEKVIKALGLTPAGDREKAKKMIEEAMNEAAEHLKEYGYDLYKKDGVWTLKRPDGTEAPVTVILWIRIEDERREIGHYVADLLEEVGFKVVRNEIDRTMIRYVYYGDPARLEWHMYTEGWVRTTDSPWMEWSLAWYYSAWLGWLPSVIWEEPNPEIEELTKKLCFFKDVRTLDDYWKLFVEITKLGIQHAIRVFLIQCEEYFAVNKERVYNLVYGALTGLWTRWPFRVATTPDKVIRIGQFAAPGRLFMSPWNPVGGITDIYSSMIWAYVTDMAGWSHPTIGEFYPIRATWTVEIDPEGKIPVPKDTLYYDPKANEWKEVGEGKTAYAKVVYNYKLSNWHDGAPMSLADIMYVWTFYWEWAFEDEEGDPYYHPEIAADWQPYLEEIIGIEIVNETAIALYGTYFHISKSETASYYSLWASMPIEIFAGSEYAIVEIGGYDWFGGPGLKWLDYLNPDHCKDVLKGIEALAAGAYKTPELEALEKLATKYPALKVDLKTRLDAVKKFFDTYGHLVISNGPFKLVKVDPATLTFELEANRDPTYPFTPDYWLTTFRASKITFAKAPEAPKSILAGITDLVIGVWLNEEVMFPEVGTYPARYAYVVATLKDPTGKVVGEFEGKKIKDGYWEIKIPKDVFAGLPAGKYTYTIEIRAALTREALPEIYPTPLKITVVAVGVSTTPTTPATTPTLPTVTITTAPVSPTPTIPTVTAPTVTVSKPSAITPVTVTTPTVTRPPVEMYAVVFIVIGIIIAAALMVVGRKK